MATKANYWILWRVPLVVVLAAVLAGCGGVNKNKYDLIKTGMSLKDVEDILGKGTQLEAPGEQSKADVPGQATVPKKLDAPRPVNSVWMRWGSDTKNIKLLIINGKVFTKQQEGL